MLLVVPPLAPSVGAWSYSSLPNQRTQRRFSSCTITKSWETPESFEELKGIKEASLHINQKEITKAAKSLDTTVNEQKKIVIIVKQILK